MDNLSIEELKELRTFKMDLADWVKFPCLKVEFNEEVTNKMNAGYAGMAMHIKPMVTSPSKFDYIFVEIYDIAYSDFKGKIALRCIEGFVRAHFIDLEYKEGVTSLKASHHVMKSPSIVLVRVFILKKILTKYSILSTKNDISINVTFCKQQGVIDTFFVVGQQYSFSKLMFIPSSSKNNLINICIQKDAKNHSKLETENQFVYCSLVEKFPIFRINFNFDYESLIRGKFLHNFNPQEFSIGIGARLTSTMFQHSVSLFRSYVSCYNKGLWDVVTNKDKNLNQRLN